MKNMVKIGNKWYVPQIETAYIIMPPIGTSQPFSGRANAYLFQNAGNCDILLSNGFTLAPGQNQWFGNYNELNIMSVDINIQFLPSTNTSGDPLVQRLEIIEVIANFTGSGFWIDQPEIPVVNTAP